MRICRAFVSTACLLVCAAFDCYAAMVLVNVFVVVAAAAATAVCSFAVSPPFFAALFCVLICVTLDKLLSGSGFI